MVEILNEERKRKDKFQENRIISIKKQHWFDKVSKYKNNFEIIVLDVKVSEKKKKDKN